MKTYSKYLSTFFIGLQHPLHPVLMNDLIVLCHALINSNHQSAVIYFLDYKLFVNLTIKIHSSLPLFK